MVEYVTGLQKKNKGAVATDLKLVFMTVKLFSELF